MNQLQNDLERIREIVHSYGLKSDRDAFSRILAAVRKADTVESDKLPENKRFRWG
jgi:hypothetical protein